MPSIVVFHTTTKEIIQCQNLLSVPADIIEFGRRVLNRKQLSYDDYTIATVDTPVSLKQFNQRFYIDGVTITPKPTISLFVDKTQIISDGVDTATVSGIPEGAEIYINGELFDIADATGELEITSEVPKVFNVKCSIFPYIDGEIDVEAA